MASNRTPAERDAHRAEIARLVMQEQSIRAIAEMLGLSTTTVQADLRFLRREWQRSAAIDTAEERGRKLGQFKLTARHAWEDYYESKQDREKTKTRLMHGEKGQTTLAETVKEGRVSDPHYLDVVISCAREECRILGLYAPTKSEGRFEHEHHHTVQTELDREFARLVGRLERGEEDPRPQPGERLPRGFPGPG